MHGSSAVATSVPALFMGGRAQHVINSGKEGRGREGRGALFPSLCTPLARKSNVDFVSISLFDYTTTNRDFDPEHKIRFAFVYLQATFGDPLHIDLQTYKLFSVHTY